MLLQKFYRLILHPNLLIQQSLAGLIFLQNNILLKTSIIQFLKLILENRNYDIREKFNYSQFCIYSFIYENFVKIYFNVRRHVGIYYNEKTF